MFVYNFRVNTASEHHPDAPSLEFSNDSDSDCYIIDSGSEVEIEYDESESELENLESEDEMVKAGKNSTCKEVISDVDTIDDSDDDFGPNVTDRIVWGKPICSRRFLEVRRKVEKAWRIRNHNLARTLNWSKIMRSKGYLLVKAACKQVQRDTQ